MGERAKLLAERIKHERQLREAQYAAFYHERELRSLYDAHEREMRKTNEEAVEKARAEHDKVIALHLDQLNHAAERLDNMTASFMPIDRFEREHSNLVARYEREHASLVEKVAQQENVTVRQDTTAALLSTGQANHRWLIGISVGLIAVFVSSVLSALALVAHLVHLY